MQQAVINLAVGIGFACQQGILNRLILFGQRRVLQVIDLRFELRFGLKRRDIFGMDAIAHVGGG